MLDHETLISMTWWLHITHLRSELILIQVLRWGRIGIIIITMKHLLFPSSLSLKWVDIFDVQLFSLITSSLFSLVISLSHGNSSGPRLGEFPGEKSNNHHDIIVFKMYYVIYSKWARIWINTEFQVVSLQSMIPSWPSKFLKELRFGN